MVTMSSSDFNRGKQLVQVEGIFIRESEKADLVDFPNKTEPAWLPKSQYGRPLDITDVSTGSCTVIIPRWLADTKGLDYEEYDIPEGGLPDEELADRDSYTQMHAEPDS